MLQVESGLHLLHKRTMPKSL